MSERESLRISTRPFFVGIPTSISSPNRFDAKNDVSIFSRLLAVPTTLMWSFLPIKSNADFILLVTVSCVRERSSGTGATWSKSSKTITAGCWDSAALNNDKTSGSSFRDSKWLLGTNNSFASALAAIDFDIIVFPVPDGPYNRTPFGGFTPSNKDGWRKGRTTCCCICLLISFNPGISSSVRSGVCSSLLALSTETASSAPSSMILITVSSVTLTAFVSGCISEMPNSVTLPLTRIDTDSPFEKYAPDSRDWSPDSTVRVSSVLIVPLVGPTSITSASEALIGLIFPCCCSVIPSWLAVYLSIRSDLILFFPARSSATEDFGPTETVTGEPELIPSIRDTAERGIFAVFKSNESSGSTDTSTFIHYTSGGYKKYYRQFWKR